MRKAEQQVPTCASARAGLAATLAVGFLIAGPAGVDGQWTNRYQKIPAMSHHVYLEGYNLPTMANGPLGAAPSPDGSSIAFSSRGWIWIMDVETRVAERLTSGAEMDFSPAWAPDGSSIAFVRDTDLDTRVVVLDLASGRERVFDTPAMELDPSFTPDGGALFVASSREGSFDLWRIDFGNEEWTRVTALSGHEFRPQPRADGSVVYVHKAGAEALRLLDPVTGEHQTLAEERILSMTRPALSRDGSTLAYNWPTQDGFELRLLSVDAPTSTVELTTARGLPLTPSFGQDGAWVWYSEANDDETMSLFRVRSVGGAPEEVRVTAWEWGEATARLRIRTSMVGRPGSAPARLEVLDHSGHPAVPEVGQPRFDGQHGRVFFNSPGVSEVVVPAGAVRISAVQGLATPEVSTTLDVSPGATVDVGLELEAVWDAGGAGWNAADHHFHLNYGGPFRLDPDDLRLIMAAEGLDVGTPLLANLHNRFGDQELWGWQWGATTPMARFGQEIRSHFLGHMAFLGTTDLYWPWVWGPGYQVYGADDRPNTEATAVARAQGGLSTYVHPTSERDPFAPGVGGSLPVELVVDGILGDMDLLEVVCLWTDEIGTAELWYRFLNLGVPIAPNAGSDVMNNFYRTMAPGTARVYVRTDGATDWASHQRALAQGRSFVTTGPMVEFDIAGAEPGDVVSSGTQSWSLDVHTAVPVERLEVLVNGLVVWEGTVPQGAAHASYEGELALPEGGWVAARVIGGPGGWPSMATYAFAHTAPVWIGAVGSVDAGARRRAAEELIPLLDAARARLRTGYGETATPRIDARFDAARDVLRQASGG